MLAYIEAAITLGSVDIRFQSDSCCGDIEEAGERQGGFVVAGNDASLVPEEGEHALDAVSILAPPDTAWRWAFTVRFWRDYGQAAMQQKVLAEGVAMIPLINQSAFAVEADIAVRMRAMAAR